MIADFKPQEKLTSYFTSNNLTDTTTTCTKQGPDDSIYFIGIAVQNSNHGWWIAKFNCVTGLISAFRFYILEYEYFFVKVLV